VSEASESKRDGSALQPNSGRGQTAKGDAVLEPFLIDYKEYAASFAVSVSNWAKLSKDAIISGRREPAFKLVLGREQDRKVRVWVVSDEMFHEMRNAWLEKKEKTNE